jgi:uncharacterized protein
MPRAVPEKSSEALARRQLGQAISGLRRAKSSRRHGHGSQSGRRGVNCVDFPVDPLSGDVSVGARLVLTARSYRRTVTPSLVRIRRLAESWSRRQFDVLQPEECKMASNQGGGSEQSGGSERQGEADKKGGQQSQQPSESGSKQQSGGSQRGGSGNFANDPERASEAGRKGGEHSHGGDSQNK